MVVILEITPVEGSLANLANWRIGYLKNAISTLSENATERFFEKSWSDFGFSAYVLYVSRRNA